MSAVILTSSEGEYGIAESIRLLQRGAPLLDALQAGIEQVESDKRARTVGFGGAPNILGQMELDASIMDGDTLMSGAVGAVQGVPHPIALARKVMETLPHVFLVGDGARRFAHEVGLDSGDVLADESRDAWHKWLEQNVPKDDRENLDQAKLAKYISFKTRSSISLGTVTFLIRSEQGACVGGVSTSGWAYSYPGRLGDSPVIGAGLYVDNRYGAASCTHTGEMTIRSSTARSVVLYMKKGARVEEACEEALQDLRDLKGGYLGNVIVHAFDKHGKICVKSIGEFKQSHYCWWQSGMAQFETVRL